MITVKSLDKDELYALFPYLRNKIEVPDVTKTSESGIVTILEREMLKDAKLVTIENCFREPTYQVGVNGPLIVESQSIELVLGGKKIDLDFSFGRNGLTKIWLEGDKNCGKITAEPMFVVLQLSIARTVQGWIGHSKETSHYVTVYRL